MPCVFFISAARFRLSFQALPGGFVPGWSFSDSACHFSTPNFLPTLMKALMARSSCSRL